MPCKFIMRRIIWECCCTHSPSFQPQLGANRQTDAAPLTSLPYPLMRSQHPLNKKAFLQSFLPFLLVCAGDLQRPLEVLPFLCDSPCIRGVNACSSNLLFRTPPIFASSHCLMLPPSAHVLSPNISLEPDGCKSGCEWKSVEGCVWLSVSSAWFRSRSDLVFLLRGGRKRDKVKHTRIADEGDEAKIGKGRIKTDMGKESVSKIYL